MKIESVGAKSAVLLGTFIALAFIFTFLREPLAEANNWLLMALREGHVARGVDKKSPVAANAPPKMKIEQIKGGVSAPQNAPAQAQPVVTGSTVWEKSFKGVPKYEVAAKGEKGETWIMQWAILGPLYFARHPERKDDFCFQESVDIPLLDDERSLNGAQLFSFAKWSNLISTCSNGKIDVDTITSTATFALCYGVVLIDSPVEMQDVKLKAGSDDYAKIWVDGEQVLKYNVKCRGYSPDSDTSDAFTLKKGVTRIVFKCVQISGSWALGARLVDKNGEKIVLKKDPVYVK